jgi:hypothetical protein
MNIYGDLFDNSDLQDFLINYDLNDHPKIADDQQLEAIKD